MDTKEVEVKNEISNFLQGHNTQKYVVNVETVYYNNRASCIIHEPDKEPYLKTIEYTPFLYLKNLEKFRIELYDGVREHQRQAEFNHCISIEELNTGNNPRLEEGFTHKISSSRSYTDILSFLKEGGVDMWEKYSLTEFSKIQFPVRIPMWYNKEFHSGIVKLLKKKKKIEAIRVLSNEVVKYNNDVFSKSIIIWANELCSYLLKVINGEYKYKHLFFSMKTDEQFFISTGIRLFKGIEHYNELHKVVFDIETTGLKYKRDRIFQIGIRDNRGFEEIIEVNKDNDDEEEKRIIVKFFETINQIRPAVIAGYHSEEFDFPFILGRAIEELKMNIALFRTTLSKITYLDENDNIDKYKFKIRRKDNCSVKYGSTAEKYTSTLMWGYTVIDIIHAVKRTAAVNSEIKNNKLKYICKYEKIAKPNRMYAEGDRIHDIWEENKIHIVNPVNNSYEEIPTEYQLDGNKLFDLQTLKEKNDPDYQTHRVQTINELSNTGILDWLKSKMTIYTKDFKLIKGSTIIRQYLLDDLWETEKVDGLYNQSSFLLAKIVPTTYSRICTMGNAAVWNLIMTTWSYENNIAIPSPDSSDEFSGGLARCYKKGYIENIAKIDYRAMYPMIQLTNDIFPPFDITGVIKKILLYLTSTRNEFKILAGDESPLPKEERNTYKVKQLPIKILNNSLFGALGSGRAFNWSDTLCAARITCVGRIHLRQMITWFMQYQLTPILAVTDGVNFSFPTDSAFDINKVPFGNGITKPIDEAWIYMLDGRTFTGIRALSEKFNKEEMPQPFMGVDMDGIWKSSLTLSRINYANLTNEEVDKKSGNIISPKIKLTGNTIKSKTMPEYIEDFIDNGLKLILNNKGEEFVEYYNEYLKKIYYKQIPFKKIATKTKYKKTIKDYLNRGFNKNNQPKAKQAHMELIIQQKNDAITKQYEKQYGVDATTVMEKNDRLVIDMYAKLYGADNGESSATLAEKKEMVGHFLYSEPELDTYLYYVNIGIKKSQGDSSKISNENGEMVLASKLISVEDLELNPELTGNYNVAKYVDSFNKRANSIMEGYSPEIKAEILIKDPSKREYLDSKDLVLRSFKGDDYDESLILEEKELRFWNRTGYDPNLIWKGFSLPSEHALDNLIEYKEKIEILNNKFKAAGDKRVVKSVNDKLVEGDFILLKNFISYDLYLFNGIFIEWRKKVFEEDKIMKLYDFIDAGLSKATIQAKKEYATKFKELFKIPQESMLSTIPKGVEMFEEFYAIELIAAKKKQKQIDADEDEALEDLKFLDSAGTDIERD
jgi:DNA polymerase elongation subunit (family B)